MGQKWIEREREKHRCGAKEFWIFSSWSNETSQEIPSICITRRKFLPDSKRKYGKLSSFTQVMFNNVRERNVFVGERKFFSEREKHEENWKRGNFRWREKGRIQSLKSLVGRQPGMNWLFQRLFNLTFFNLSYSHYKRTSLS